MKKEKNKIYVLNQKRNKLKIYQIKMKVVKMMNILIQKECLIENIN